MERGRGAAGDGDVEAGAWRGAEHPHLLTIMANLALTCRDQGRWKEAEELVMLVMETRKRVLGEELLDSRA